MHGNFGGINPFMPLLGVPLTTGIIEYRRNVFNAVTSQESISRPRKDELQSMLTVVELGKAIQTCKKFASTAPHDQRFS